jgi:hypothetical protein
MILRASRGREERDDAKQVRLRFIESLNLHFHARAENAARIFDLLAWNGGRRS